MQATINGIKLAFDDIGRGPAVILLHGFPFNRQMWSPQINALAENGFRVIAPDLRGFGESEAGDKPFSIRTFADDVNRLMKYLGIGRAVLVGMSLGGEVVLELLRLHPRKVVATSILSPVMPPSNAEEQIRYLNFAELVREGHHQTAIDGFCQWLLPGELQNEMAEQTRQLMETVNLQTLSKGMSFCADHQKWVERGERHTTPTLVVSGENDPLSSPKQAKTMTKLLPIGRHHVIPEAGHLFNMEVPDDLNQYLVEFLCEVSDYKPSYLRLAADRVKSSLNFDFLLNQDDEETEYEGTATA